MNAMAPGAKGMATPVAASVLIPAYQAEAYVASAIRSALAQTRPDIEVIVADDGSTDRTWDVILGCAREDARVVPVRLPGRGGPSAARNAAIERARGRWLAVLDSDDLYMPERLDRMIAVAEASQAHLLADNILIMDFVTGQVLGERFSRDTMTREAPVRLIDALLRDMPAQAAAGEMFGLFQPIIRRDFLVRHGIRYAEDIKVGEDFLLYAECIVRGGRFHLMPEAGYVQRLRPGSQSARREAMLYLSAANRRISSITAGLKDSELNGVLQLRQQQIDIDCFSQLLERGHIRDALRHAHCGSPRRLLRHARAVGGAIRGLATRARRSSETTLSASATLLHGSAQ